MNSKLIDPFTGPPPATAKRPVNQTSRRLQLVWSLKPEPTVMVRVAFATTDRLRVDQHFGAAESFAVYEVTPDKSTLIAVVDFTREAMDGNEDKLAAKVEFLAGCAAVYVLAIGASAIRQLTAKGIQPLRINACDDVQELLDEIVLALSQGGVAWIERALAASARSRSEQRFARMEEEGWHGGEGWEGGEG